MVLKEKEFQTGNVLTISIAHLIHDIYSSFLAPILPLLIEKLGISYSLAGFLSVVQRLPSIMNPFIGLLADRLSVRYFIIIAPALTAVSMSLLGMAPHYTILVILLFIMGVSAAIFHVPAPVMIKQIAGPDTGKGMSFYMLGGELARTIGPLIILGAVSLWTLEGTFRLIPFGLLASLLVFIKLRKINLVTNHKKNKKQAGANDTLKKLLPFFSVLFAITFFRSITKSALSAFLPTFLNVRGESLWMGGIALSVLQLAGAVGTFFSGPISDKVGRKPTLMIIALLSPLLMWLFIVVDSTFTLPILVLIGLFMFAGQPVLLALVQDLDSDRPAFVNGIYMGISFVISSVAVILIGIIGDWIGLENSFRLSAFLALGGIPATMLLPGKKMKKK